jgi:hypothetical protein
MNRIELSIGLCWVTFLMDVDTVNARIEAGPLGFYIDDPAEASGKTK